MNKKEIFRDWLRNNMESISYKKFVDDKKSYTDITIFMKIHQYQDIYYVYSSNYYSRNKEDSKLVTSKNKFEFFCIYDSSNNKLHDVQYKYNADDYIDSSNKEQYKDVTIDAAKIKIRELINFKINNNIDDFKNGVLDDRHKKSIDDYKKYSVAELASNGFHKNKVLDDIKYDCGTVNLNSSNCSEEEYIKLILDFDQFCTDFAQSFINANKEHISVKLLEIDILKEVLKNLINDESGDHYVRRNISNAVNSANCKTVNVTTDIDNFHLTFKMDSNSLMTNNLYYNTYNIANKRDRDIFESRYGRMRNIYPKDIVRITYGKKIIYCR